MPRKRQQPAYPSWLADKSPEPDITSLYGSLSLKLHRALLDKPESVLQDILQRAQGGDDCVSILRELGIHESTYASEGLEDDAVFRRFVSAMAVTALYLQKGETAQRAGQPRKRDEIVKLGSAINLAFVDFFIGVGDKYGYDLAKLLGVYAGVLRHNESLRGRLRMFDEEGIISGIAGAIRAYDYLHGEKYPQAIFSAPTVDEDVHHKVDLVCEDKNEDGKTTAKRLFQIKGRQNGEKVVMFDVTKIEDLNALRQLFPHGRERDYEEAVQRLIAYRADLEAHAGYPVSAFWVEVLLDAPL